MADHWIIDPDDTVEYQFDWAPLENGTGDSNWLDRTSSPIEGISTATITSPSSPGPTIVSSAIGSNNTVVTVKISAANTTAGTTYPIPCQITTTAGQTRTRTAYLFVSNQ